MIKKIENDKINVKKKKKKNHQIKEIGVILRIFLV